MSFIRSYPGSFQPKASFSDEAILGLLIPFNGSRIQLFIILPIALLEVKPGFKNGFKNKKRARDLISAGLQKEIYMSKRGLSIV
jgi:hypothetical protein